MLAGMELAALKQNFGRLSRRYRAELLDGQQHLDNEESVAAYLAARMPATYAAIRASLSAIREARPDYAPASLLDFGAGPGAVLWAARDCWASLRQATMIEASDAARETGERLADGEFGDVRWIAGDITTDALFPEPADLAAMAYVLDEITPEGRGPLVSRIWRLTSDILLVIEPGTPGGWRRILAARDQLLSEGAFIVAPCAHSGRCAIKEPDWCHFSRRVARSRLHRLVKEGDAPWEDETYIFIAASRTPGNDLRPRIVAPPRRAHGRIELKLCQTNGAVIEDLVTRREGERFKRARRADWGDAF